LSQEKPLLPKLLDYTPEMTHSFSEDIRIINKLTEDQAKKVIEKAILWKLREEYLNQQIAEKFAEELGISPPDLDSVIRFVFFMLAACYRTKLDRDSLAKETEKAGLSQTLLKILLNISDKYSSKLRAFYKRDYGYCSLLSSIYWRVDIKLADTKRYDEPEIRIFMDFEVQKPDLEDERFVLELKEDDLFMFTRSIGDIAIEVGKIREKWLQKKSGA